MAGWRRERKTSAFDVVAMLAVAALAIAEATLGIEAATSPTGLKAGYPAALFFIFAAIGALYAQADIRMIAHGGIAGAQRLVRHVGRMSVAFLIALLSFYPSRARLFSKAVNDSHLLYMPHILVAGTAMFWIIRLLGRRKGARDGRYEKERPNRRIFVPVAHDGTV
jgi:hypothetical protein